MSLSRECRRAICITIVIDSSLTGLYGRLYTGDGSPSHSDRRHGAARGLCMMPLMGEAVRGMASRMVS